MKNIVDANFDQQIAAVQKFVLKLQQRANLAPEQTLSVQREVFETLLSLCAYASLCPPRYWTTSYIKVVADGVRQMQS